MLRDTLITIKLLYRRLENKLRGIFFQPLIDKIIGFSNILIMGGRGRKEKVSRLFNKQGIRRGTLFAASFAAMFLCCCC